ncbi:D-alanyl-D-alanine carboxypeptidase family protein [Magnetospirillum moscoviense]|uniref:D-alanyl-D-alanine carboxypeptidase family protein n=1 Tax=Magnetospirillum moscoviense TaxID=1437059 RepID=UPI001FE1BD49|nr:D-alanyl-D-alanine carboxypeptidase family protein [Magnetospirillum moscoviense]
MFAATMLALQPAAAQPRESRYAAIVIDADDGDVLYAVNPDRRSYPASLTKVMTLYLMFDALDSGRMSLATTMPVSAHAAAQAPSKLGLRPGDRISVEDAVLALVTKSANDVAVVIAEALGGSEDSFAAMMTRKARQLGMNATTYQNASGLPDLDQISTPRDQALLGRAIARNHARHYHYFSTRQFKWRGQPISTHNRLMLRYQGADGIKTGYINASGFNLLASAKRDGRRIVGVVFGGDTAAGRDRNMAQILDKGFARVKAGNHGIRSAQAEDEDRADLDRLIAATQTGKASGSKTLSMAGARHGEDLGSGDVDSDSWAIQVGAFGSHKPAHQAASAAASKLGGLVSRATIDIDKVKAGKAHTFRARLTGFTEDQARAACKRLAKAKKDCKLVQPSS